MRRRDFIAGLGSAAAWPMAARAQSEHMRRIGMLDGLAENDRDNQADLNALREGLAKLGWIEGRNVRIDVRFGAGEPDRNPPASTPARHPPPLRQPGGHAFAGPGRPETPAGTFPMW
jgi:hypothetical protein